MQHFALGLGTGLLVWLVAFVIYRAKGWSFSHNISGYIQKALLWGLIGGVANLAVDIDFLLHQQLGLPYRFWHTPALIIGATFVVASFLYLWRIVPNGKRTYTSFMVLVVGLSFVTHLLEDYLFNWF